MKNFSLMRKTALVAIICSSFVMGLSAQKKSSFARVGAEGEIEQGTMFPGTHRSCAVFGDYNNDGHIDIFYGGQDPSNSDEKWGWNCQSNLMKNNGDGTFTYVSTEESGLPINSWSSFIFLDYNNDGNLDLFVVGTGEYNLDVPNYSVLYKNLGPEHNYRFELVETAEFLGGQNENQWKSAIAVGDYDKDGFTDIAITGYNGGDDGVGRFVRLYKNNGDGTFTNQEVATTIDGVFDEEGNPLKIFKPMSHGSVMFGDIDGDGWLDLVCTGYADQNNTGIRIYKNMQDGTFNDITPIDDIHGSNEGETILADINGDGLLDIFVTGFEDGRVASVFMNNGIGGFDYLDQHSLGLKGANKTSILAADFNNDGLLDLMYQGWDNTDGVPNATKIFYQNAMGTFTLDESYPIIRVEDSSSGLAMGDFDGDNTMDIFISGYNSSDVEGSYGCPARLYKNTLGEDVSTNKAPSAPENLKAEIKDGFLTVSWDPASDDHTPVEALAYNVYVYGKDGIFTIIPADIKTGKLKTTKSYAIAPRSTSFTMKLADGDYTLGVQAIDQSIVGGSFATVNIGKGWSSIEQIQANFLVKSVDGGIIVDADNLETVVVRDITGRVIAQGQTNQVISVASRQILLVSVAGKTVKFIK